MVGLLGVAGSETPMLGCSLTNKYSISWQISFANMNRSLQWDDLRVVLAIVRAGSLSGAARGLGVSHATVFRRLQTVEERLGVRLFERGRSGYTATAAGEALAVTAEDMETRVLDVERQVAGRDLQPVGTVRLTTTDTLFDRVLSPLLAECRRAYPEIALEVVVPSQRVNLSRREADIAIRPSSNPPPTLVGRRVGVVRQAIYLHQQLASKAADWQALDWIGPDDSMGYRSLDGWMRKQGVDGRCRLRVDTTRGLYAAVRDGLGPAVLPCYLGDSNPDLRRLDDVPSLTSDLWLLTHADLRKTARIRVLMDFLGDALRAHPQVGLGE